MHNTSMCDFMALKINYNNMTQVAAKKKRLKTEKEREQHHDPSE